MAENKISRRDFLKLAGSAAGLTALAFGPPILRATAKSLFSTENTPSHEFDPHSLVPLYPYNTMTGLLLDDQNRLQRSVEPPPYVQGKLDETLKVFVPWQGRDPRKPDAPGGVCDFTLPDGKHLEKKLVYRQDVKLEGSNENPYKGDPIDIDCLVPIFDSHTGNVLVTDANGIVIRVVPPPEYQQNIADQKFTAAIPYHTYGGKKPDGPFPPGWCVIGTPNGVRNSIPLQYPKSIKVSK